MKEVELRKHTLCSICGQKVLHTGVPLFWKVTVERFGVDLRATQRQDGLAAFIGNTAIASVMGPGEDLAKPMMEAQVLTLCEECAFGGAPVCAVAMEKRS